MQRRAIKGRPVISKTSDSHTKLRRGRVHQPRAEMARVIRLVKLANEVHNVPVLHVISCGLPVTADGHLKTHKERGKLVREALSQGPLTKMQARIQGRSSSQLCLCVKGNFCILFP